MLDYKNLNIDDLKEFIGINDLNIRDDEGKTPFYWICCYSYQNGFNLEMLKLCLEIGGDLNINDVVGCTSFHWICRYSYRNGFNLEMLKLCLDMGGDLNSKNIDGNTPFYWICCYSFDNGFNLEILKLCLKMGGDLKILSSSGYTSFYWLCDREYPNKDKIMKYIGKHKLVNGEILSECIENGSLREGYYIIYFTDGIIVDEDNGFIIY